MRFDWFRPQLVVFLMNSNSSSILATLAGALMLAASAPAATLYTAGHGDIGAGYENGAFHFHLHFHTGAIVGGSPLPGDAEFEPDEIHIVAPQAAIVTLPVAFPALDAGSGDSVWVLPATSVPDLPFLGLATEELAPTDWAGNLTFSLTSVVSPSGNGNFALWQNDAFGTPMIFMSTAIGSPNAVQMAAGGHDHYNFGFTEAGLWEVTLTISGTHSTDGFQTSTETFLFQVVPEPSSALLVALGGVSAVLRRRR